MFALFTDDGLDQLVETKAIAAREAKDLREMGCRVRIFECDERLADEIDANIRELGGMYPPCFPAK